jgi:hypothetical protein
MGRHDKQERKECSADKSEVANYGHFSTRKMSYHLAPFGDLDG